MRVGRDDERLGACVARVALPHEKCERAGCRASIAARGACCALGRDGRGASWRGRSAAQRLAATPFGERPTRPRPGHATLAPTPHARTGPRLP